jgi:hypothetical protein
MGTDLFRKILAATLLLLVMTRLLVLPRFHAFKARVDRAVNVTLLVLGGMYGFELVRWLMDKR